MTDQVETKQVTWEDFEVVEEQEVCDGCFDPQCGKYRKEITEWEEGNEPLPTEWKGDKVTNGENWADDGINPEISESELARMQEVMIAVNVSLREWSESMERMTMDFARMQEIYQYTGEGRFEAIGAIPLCTPHRNPLTVHQGDCSDGG